MTPTDQGPPAAEPAVEATAPGHAAAAPTVDGHAVAVPAALGAAAVGIAEIVDHPIDVEAHRRVVADRAAGAEVVFCGVVRDHDEGRSVLSLEYVAHPIAAQVLSDVTARLGAEPAVRAVAASHRVGSLEIGDIAMVVAVSAAHRAEAFDACARLVDELKQSLPIWKRQVFDDGTQEWVNCP